jgi:hypothetical protein
MATVYGCDHALGIGEYVGLLGRIGTNIGWFCRNDLPGCLLILPLESKKKVHLDWILLCTPRPRHLEASIYIVVNLVALLRSLCVSLG